MKEERYALKDFKKISKEEAYRVLKIGQLLPARSNNELRVIYKSMGWIAKLFIDKKIKKEYENENTSNKL